MGIFGATKEFKAESIIANFLQSQIMNLQVSLGIPWIIVNLLYGPIAIAGDSLLQIVSWGLLMVFVVLGLMTLFQLKLKNCFGILSILSYIAYICCIFNIF